MRRWPRPSWRKGSRPGFATGRSVDQNAGVTPEGRGFEPRRPRQSKALMRRDLAASRRRRTEQRCELWPVAWRGDPNAKRRRAYSVLKSSAARLAHYRCTRSTLRVSRGA
jgi:hypothetical protein